MKVLLVTLSLLSCQIPTSAAYSLRIDPEKYSISKKHAPLFLNPARALHFSVSNAPDDNHSTSSSSSSISSAWTGDLPLVHNFPLHISEFPTVLPLTAPTSQKGTAYSDRHSVVVTSVDTRETNFWYSLGAKTRAKIQKMGLFSAVAYYIISQINSATTMSIAWYMFSSSVRHSKSEKLEQTHISAVPLNTSTLSAILLLVFYRLDCPHWLLVNGKGILPSTRASWWRMPSFVHYGWVSPLRADPKWNSYLWYSKTTFSATRPKPLSWLPFSYIPWRLLTQPGAFWQRRLFRVLPSFLLLPERITLLLVLHEVTSCHLRYKTNDSFKDSNFYFNSVPPMSILLYSPGLKASTSKSVYFAATDFLIHTTRSTRPLTII